MIFFGRERNFKPTEYRWFHECSAPDCHNRHGLDDARYLTTLLHVLKNAKAADRQKELVRETHEWLENLGVDADLDAMRLEMARRIEALLKP